ncbi:hypothetical protein USB125703_00675 [Pseudoclavibacter triregionum]|nr:hypothetical protein USB125703_00675 [Pseudoclavibacter triregionum]
MRLLVSIVVNAIGLWLTTLLLSGGMSVTPFEQTTLGVVLTYLGLAAIWGLVNGILGGILRTAGFCLYVITLGLIALVVNGFLFWVVAWISEQLGWGLRVESFGWAILGALVMSIITTVLGWLVPDRSDRRRRSDDD